MIGSFLEKEKDNFVAGKSDVFVVEACEYRRSFLNLSPKILVITNIDADHLDYYGNLAGVQKGFAEMVAKVPRTGLSCDPGNTKVKPAIEKTKARIIDYTKEKLVVTLPVSGEHNRENARAALAVARLASVDTKRRENHLRTFMAHGGVWNIRGRHGAGLLYMMIMGITRQRSGEPFRVFGNGTKRQDHRRVPAASLFAYQTSAQRFCEGFRRRG